MIEARIVPATGNVAGFTFAAITSRMVVFTQVATDTVARQAVLEVLTGVAVLAVQATVAFRQGESGFLEMVESDAFPRGCRVTVMTGRPVATTVYVVNSVAADTLGRRSIEGIAAMAIDTGNRGVFARQSIADRIVIETGI